MLKVVLLPGQILELEGCPVTEGPELTVKVAALLVATSPQGPLTTHWYWYEFIPDVAAVMFMVAVVTVV